MELLKGEYASTILMPTKIYIFGNWMEWHICGDSCPINKCTHLDKYAMPLSKDIFDALGQAKVFNTLDLRFGYHKLPLKEGDKVKMTFWGIDHYGKDCLYQWWFLPFSLKNAPAKFQRVMDRVLARLGFAKCYIDDIIVFSSTSKDHKYHLYEVFRRLKDHNLKFHPSKCRFFRIQVEYLGHMIYLGGLGIYKAKVEAISHVPQLTYIS